MPADWSTPRPFRALLYVKHMPEPRLRDKAVAGIGRTHAVFGQVPHRSLGGGRGEDIVERNEHGAEFAGKPPHRCDLRIKVLAPGAGHEPARQRERLAEHQRGRGFVTRGLENPAKNRFEFRGGGLLAAVELPPRVVDAREYRNDGRPQEHRVPPPSRGQVFDSVAGNSFIEKRETEVRELCRQPRRHQQRIPAAHGTYLARAPTAVGDAVADEKDGISPRKGNGHRGLLFTDANRSAGAYLSDAIAEFVEGEGLGEDGNARRGRSALDLAGGVFEDHRLAADGLEFFPDYGRSRLSLRVGKTRGHDDQVVGPFCRPELIAEPVGIEHPFHQNVPEIDDENVVHQFLDIEIIIRDKYSHRHRAVSVECLPSQDFKKYILNHNAPTNSGC